MTPNSTELGTVEANKANIDLSGVSKEVTLGDITITDELILTGSNTVATDANIKVTEDATNTNIILNSSDESDSFRITTEDYDNDATLTVSGDFTWWYK